MKNTIFLLIAIISFNSCLTNEDETDSLVVDIQKVKGEDFFNRVLRPLSLLDTIPSYIKGIPTLDTLRISVIYNYKASNEIINQKKIKNNIFALTGYLNDKQVVIVDTNNNYDFSDDDIINFSKDFKFSVASNKRISDSLKLRSIPYQRYEEEKIFTDTVNLKILPYYGYSLPIRDSIKENYKLVAEINEYWRGKFHFNKRLYYLALNENNIFGEKLLIGKSKDDFKNLKQGNFLSYSTKDTIKLNDELLIVKEISYRKRKIIFKKIDRKNTLVGYRKGDKFDNVNFQDILKEQNFNTDDLLKEKKFLLIDFWGTWCAPCKELTPDLIEINKKYDSKLTILSFAYDKKKDDVLDYINKNNMNWSHAFIYGNAKDKNSRPKIIENLRIESYPTFILIDAKGTILLRGSRKNILKQIEEILQK